MPENSKLRVRAMEIWLRDFPGSEELAICTFAMNG
jgi:hypothetical protein